MSGSKERQEKYIPFHVHSNYSLLPIKKERIAAVSSPESLVTGAKKKGLEGIALTDTNLFGLIRFMKVCQEEGLKAIPGLELPVEFDVFEKPSRVTLLAKNNLGLIRIFELASKAQRDCEFPVPSDLEKSRDSLVVLVRGKLGGFRDLINQDGIFVAIDTPPSDFESTQRLLTLEEETGKTIVAHEIRMTETSQIRVFNLILRLFKNSGTGINSAFPENLVLKGPIETASLYKNFSGPVGKTHEIAQEIRVDLPQAPALKAKITEEEGGGKGSHEFLEDLTWRKAQRFPDLEDMKERLAMELSVIRQLGFSDVYLIVYEIARFCQQRDIEVRQSGSGINSQVLMVLGVHDIDARNLLFERFINRERILGSVSRDFPDVDLEIDPPRRSEVINFLLNRYGNTTLLAIVHRLGSPGVIHLGVQGNIKLSPEEKEILVETALPYKITTHPGIVFMDNPPQILSGGKAIAQLDKVDAEDILHLLKIDFPQRLGERKIAEVREILAKEGMVFEVPESDEKALARLFFAKKTIGITNVESPHLRRILSMIGERLKRSGERPTIEHLAHALSLARPAAARARQRYLKGIQKEVSIFAEDGEVVEKLGGTHFVAINQDDVMKIAKLAELSDSFADRLRKFLSKGASDEEQRSLLDTLYRALTSKFPSYKADELFAQVAGFVGYGFPAGHALSYAKIAYELSFYAENFPTEFWTTVLGVAAERKKDQPYPLQAYVNEAIRDRITFSFPPIDRLPAKPQVGEPARKQITVGKSLFWQSKDFPIGYDQFRKMAGEKAVSTKELIWFQMTNFGVCLTHNPIAYFDPRLHFRPQRESQEIVGLVTLISRYEKEDIEFLTLDSGRILDATITQPLAKKYESLLGTPFLRIRIVKDDGHWNSWKILEVLPLAR